LCGCCAEKIGHIKDKTTQNKKFGKVVAVTTIRLGKKRITKNQGE